MTTHVLGGGVAGIAAAFAALDRGDRVALLEARAHLGGRVFSFDDRRMGGPIDNGPHVMLGCYDAMRGLLRRLGTEAAFARPDRLELAFREPGGRASRLRLPRLPVRLAMPAALVAMSVWSTGARLRALRGMAATLRSIDRSASFGDWLRRHGQEGVPRRFLWEPLCVAVMNAAPDAVSAATFVHTLRTAFRGGPRRAAIWLAREPWRDIVGRPAGRALAEAGADVACGAAVARLEIEGGRVAALRLANGERCDVAAEDLVVSALPWNGFARVVGEEPGSPPFRDLPIVNVYFDYGEVAVIDEPAALVALVDGEPFQFLYRRPGDRAGRFALIAGACDGLDGVPAAEIEARARAQLARFYPGARVDAPARIRVTKEPRATLVVSPQTAARRPRPGPWPGIANLWVCGDWTETGFPSTLEGAARSAGMLPW